MEEQAKETEKGIGSALPAPVRAKLNSPISKSAIQKHPTRPYLSTIKAMFVVERLNDAFGIGGWDIEHSILENTPEHVIVVGRIYIKEHDIYTPIQYGGHPKGVKGGEPADAFKSAVTECLSKCASYLEIGIEVFKGEADKQPENKPKPPVKEPPPANPKPEPKTKPKPKPEPATPKESPTEEEDEQADAAPDIKEFMERIDAYVDADALKADALRIIEDAENMGAAEEQVSELKKYINSTYKSLVIQ